jgi:hypothetical protein
MDMNNSDNIPINFWDDFYDDDFVPEGKIQETYAYIEERNYPLEKQKDCLYLLLSYINENIKLEGVKIWIEFYDSKKEYPDLIGTENEWCLFERLEIKIENITHVQLEYLIEELNSVTLMFDNLQLNIYSES